MQRCQFANALQRSEGSGLLLGLTVGVEKFGLHALWAMADQLQCQGFDAGGMQSAENLEDAHQRIPSSSP